jgi:hypothetical protein
MKPTLITVGLFSFLLAGPSYAATAKPVAKAKAAPVEAVSVEATATIEAVIGTVRVKLSPASQPVNAVKGTSLIEGAQVITLDNSRAMIRFSSTDIVRLGPRSTLVIAALPEAGKKVTLLRLVSGTVRAMLRRSGAQRSDFAIASSGAVCAIKGTVVSIATNPDGTASFTVDNGSAQVFKIDNPGDMVAAFNSVLNNLADQKNVTVVKDGFQVTASAAALSKAVVAPVNPNLEVVSGSVKVTVNGVTTTLVAGDTIPNGAKVESSDGAVLQGSKITVDCPAGSTFNYAATVAGNTLSTVVTPEAGSAPVKVGIGQTSINVEAGDAVSITKNPMEQTKVKAVAGTLQMTNPDGSTRAISAPPAEGKTEGTGGAKPGADPKAPPATVVIQDAPIDLPPPPPQTPKQEAQEVSPIAPKSQ